MYNDRDPNSSPMNIGGGNPSFKPGTDVYDVNGDKIGSVQQYNPQAHCIVVEKGMLFKQDLYIPTNDIQRTTADGIYLVLSKDDLEDNRYATPPARATGYGKTLGATRDTDVDVNP